MVNFKQASLKQSDSVNVSKQKHPSVTTTKIAAV